MYTSYREARKVWIPTRAKILSETGGECVRTATVLMLVDDAIRLMRFFRTGAEWMVSCDFASKLADLPGLVSNDRYDSTINQRELPLLHVTKE